MSLLNRFPWLWYVLALVILLADQLSKHAISSHFLLYETESYTSFFQLTLRHNYGAAFSIFADGDGWQRWFLGIVAALVSVGLVVWLARMPRVFTIEGLALALVLGGAMGNLYDRVALGYVVDFIVFHYKQYEWPAFNVADSSIFVGAALLIYDAIFLKKGE